MNWLETSDNRNGFEAFCILTGRVRLDRHAKLAVGGRSSCGLPSNAAWAHLMRSLFVDRVNTQAFLTLPVPGDGDTVVDELLFFPHSPFHHP